MYAILLALLGTVSAVPVDQHATAQTRLLLESLSTIAKDASKIMFGQNEANEFGSFGGHAPYTLYPHDNLQGWLFTSYNVQQNHTMDLCDVKLLTGHYPAVTGYGITGVTDPTSAKTLTYLVHDALKNNMLLVMSWHPNNFGTGGTAWVGQDKGDALHSVRRILPGGDLNSKFHQFLDKFAAWALALKDSQGRLVPFVFRPWHELNGGWFWWGLNNKAQNTAQDLQSLYRHTVEYLRGVKGVHNILYAFSPDKFKSQADYLSIYPGDDYVDILGLDYYFNKEGCCTADFERMNKDVVAMAEARGKVPALTEVGMFDNGIAVHTDFWSNLILSTLKSAPSTRRLAFVFTWTNHCFSDHRCELWTPYKGHPAEADFHKFHDDPMTIFASEAPKFYQ